MTEFWQIPLSKLTGTYGREYIFTDKFNKAINIAALESAKKRGFIKTQKVMSVREAVCPEIASVFLKKVVDTNIYFASRVSGEYFEGFLTGKVIETNEPIIVMHPEQAETDYVPGLIHELKHLEDLFTGKKVTPTGVKIDKPSEVRKLPSERRAREAEKGLIKRAHKKAITQAIFDGKEVPLNVLRDYPDLSSHKGHLRG